MEGERKEAQEAFKEMMDKLMEGMGKDSHEGWGDSEGVSEEDRQLEMTVVRNEYERDENDPAATLDKEVTAAAFLDATRTPYSGHMVAAMALMESPAIILGVLFARLGARAAGRDAPDWRHLLRDAFLNGSVYLLVGSLVIGYLTAANSPNSVEKMLPFTDKLFYGVLSFFLLDMGIVAAQRLNDLRRAGSFLIGFAVLMPLFNALVGALIARALGLEPGNALLFVVLCASASYIAVPAAMRMTVPEANPSFYISTALGVTFPFNIIVGIPLYMGLVNALIPSAG